MARARCTILSCSWGVVVLIVERRRAYSARSVGDGNAAHLAKAKSSDAEPTWVAARGWKSGAWFRWTLRFLFVCSQFSIGRSAAGLQALFEVPKGYLSRAGTSGPWQVFGLLRLSTSFISGLFAAHLQGAGRQADQFGATFGHWRVGDGRFLF